MKYFVTAFLLTSLTSFSSESYDDKIVCSSGKVQFAGIFHQTGTYRNGDMDGFLTGVLKIKDRSVTRSYDLKGRAYRGGMLEFDNGEVRISIGVERSFIEEDMNHYEVSCPWSPTPTPVHHPGCRITHTCM